MADDEKTIGDFPVLTAMLVNKKNASLPLTHPTAIGWKCFYVDGEKGCGGTWREKVWCKYNPRPKRCPRCELGWVPKGKVVSYSKPKAIVEKKTFDKQECPVCCLESKNMCECGTCKYKACDACMKTYILSGMGVAKCMNVECNQPFSTAVLISSLTKKWVIKEYIPFLGKAMVDHERSLIPETMKLAQRTREFEEAERKHRKINAAVLAQRRITNHVNTQDEYTANEEKVKELLAKSRRLLYEKDQAMKRMGNEKWEMTKVAKGQKKPEKPKVYLQGCPSGECRGLIDVSGVCGICHTRVCNVCRCIIPIDNAQHVCDPSAIASVQEIQKTTKPCPKCASPIYKVDGCDQMWCTECHVTFSWSKGIIENGRTHNPHYFAWLRSQSGGAEIPRTPGDEDCVTVDAMENYITNGLFRHTSPDDDVTLAQFIEVRACHTQTSGTGDVNRVFSIRIDLRDLRVQYILGNIPEDKWMKKVIVLHRTIKYHEFTAGIFQTFHAILEDLIRAYYIAVKDGKNVLDEHVKFMKSAHAAREMINKEIALENCDLDYGKFDVFDSHFYPTSYKQVRVEKVST